jgi:hypothetical protein
VKVLQAQFLERGAVRPQPVRGDRFWLHELIAQQTPEKSQRGLGIAPLLNDHVEHFAFVIDGAPEVHPLAPD